MPRRRRHLARSLCTRFFLINYAAWRLCRSHCAVTRPLLATLFFSFFRTLVMVSDFFFPENIDFRLQVPWAKGKKLPINRRVEIRITIFVLNSFLYRWWIITDWEERGNYWLQRRKYWFLFHIRVLIYWSKIPKSWKNDSQSRDINFKTDRQLMKK